MPAIFVSFRKADERVGRERVYRALVEHFGRNAVFKSGEEIPPGTDFASQLLRHAADCPVMLVMIGSTWLDARDKAGQRLLDRDEDWVRREICTALRAGNRIMPVLLGDSVLLPGAQELPSEIAQLSGLQFVRVGNARNDAGIKRLIDDLTATLPALADEDAASSRKNADSSAKRRPRRQEARADGGGIALNIGNDAHDVHIAGSGDDKPPTSRKRIFRG
jgi:hypothetical protein